jgi:hypothetical protein
MFYFKNNIEKEARFLIFGLTKDGPFKKGLEKQMKCSEDKTAV